MKPTIKELADALYSEGQYLKRNFSKEDLMDGPHDDFCGTDVRLQLHDGSWELHTGDSSYDQDHRGYWGASSISRGATRRECMDTARSLINEALDDQACR